MKHKLLRKSFPVLLSLVLLLGIVGGATLAFLSTKDGAVSNSLVPGEVGCVVNSNYSVSLTEQTNVPAYVRVTWVATWKNAAGEIYYADMNGVAPIGTENNGWNNYGGFYYYPTALVPGENETTPVFASGFTYTGDASGIPEGYELKVDVLAEAIQAPGTTDVGDTPSYLDAWARAVNGE